MSRGVLHPFTQSPTIRTTQTQFVKQLDGRKFGFPWMEYFDQFVSANLTLRLQLILENTFLEEADNFPCGLLTN